VSARRKIRVAQITQNLGVGGLERVAATLAKTIDRDRFEPSVICMRLLGAFGEELREMGIPVDVVELPPNRPDYFSFVKIARFLRQRQIDVIHTHNTEAMVNGGLARVLAGFPVHIHTDHARDWPDALKQHVFEHVMSWGTRKIVGVSDHTTEALHRYEWIPRRKLMTIVNGIDPLPFDLPFDVERKRQELDLTGKGPIVGIGARLVDQKAHHYLIDAVALLQTRLPDLVLLIVGDGARRPDLEAQVQNLGMARHVRFIGERLDYHEVLRCFDIFALSSTWEGLPMVILEAMAARCPIVSTAVGGIPGTLTDGESASLVPPADPAALADAIEELWREPDRRASYADAARAIFDTRYSARAMTAQYEALYAGEPLPPARARPPAISAARSAS